MVTFTEEILNGKLCFLCSGSHCYCIIFLTSAFMYTYVMAIFINRCLVNVVFSVTKALNGQNSLKQNLNVLSKSPASLNACFPLALTPFFISIFIKSQLIPLQLHFDGLRADQL